MNNYRVTFGLVRFQPEFISVCIEADNKEEAAHLARGHIIAGLMHADYPSVEEAVDEQ